MQLVPLVLFVAVHLKNCFLLPSCHLTLMSFCTQGLPGVAESTFLKSKGKPSRWGEGPLQGGRGERHPSPSAKIGTEAEDSSLER